MWATIIMTILSFILTKKKTGSTSTALAAAALAGAGTYYATTQTDWFSADNALTSWPSGANAATSGGKPIIDANGQPVNVPGSGTTAKVVSGLVGQTIDTTGKVLTSWGGTGTATVIGTSNLTSGGSSDIPTWAKVLGIGGLIYLIAK